MNLALNKIIRGDTFEELKKFPNESVDCLITSPPYWSLRDYQTKGVIWDTKEGCGHDFKMGEKNNPMDRGGKGQHDSGGLVGKMGDKTMTKTISGFCQKCGAWKGQLGLEPTFELYIQHLGNIFDEVKRVLKKTGTCWVNLGDTYGGSNCGYGQTKESSGFQNVTKQTYYPTSKMKPLAAGIMGKCLLQIPFRFTLEMVNRGWILRNVIIWHKPNCMPSSVKDRFTVDFEYLFFFVKNKKYYFETQYEPLQESSLLRAKYNSYSSKTDKGIHGGMNLKNQLKVFEKINKGEISGRNKRCVWRIATRPFRGSHFAVFPEDLVETPIKAGCPEFVCQKCGKAREPIIKSQFKQHSLGATSGQYWKVRNFKGDNTVRNSSVKFGYTDCGCNAGFKAGVVLDPFMGSGTTAVVAKRLGRNYVGIELNPRYIEMAERRIKAVSTISRRENERIFKSRETGI